MLNKTELVVSVGRSTTSVLNTTLSGHAQEIVMATDSGVLWLCPVSSGAFVPVQTLHLAVCHENVVVCFDDEIVWSV